MSDVTMSAANVIKLAMDRFSLVNHSDRRMRNWIFLFVLDNDLLI